MIFKDLINYRENIINLKIKLIIIKIKRKEIIIKIKRKEIIINFNILLLGNNKAVLGMP